LREARLTAAAAGVIPPTMQLDAWMLRMTAALPETGQAEKEK